MKLDRRKLKQVKGISFEDYVRACAHLAQGFSEQEIINILGVNKSVWDEALKIWNERLCNLIASDPAVGALYGQIYSNPKTGKFLRLQRV